MIKKQSNWIRRALIVHKRSAFETYFREYQRPKVAQMARIGDRGLLHIRQAHDTHYHSLKRVEKILEKHAIHYQFKARGQAFDESKYDLILSVGGDGTFLDAARHIKNKFILGVNSDISHSVGRFCSSSAPAFEKHLIGLLKGSFLRKNISRFEIAVNKKPYRFPVLNDILISHLCPAAMSHYFLVIGAKKERQRSSGLWVSTAAGSTAALGSAGGKIIGLDSPLLQYRPRELFDGHGIQYVLRGGLLAPAQKIEVISQMEEGMVYVDGAHEKISFRYGDTLRLKACRQPLQVIWF